jgi:hypothetical protein
VNSHPLRILTLICLVYTAVGTAAESATFKSSLYPVFEAAACRSCHNSEGVASGTKLQFPEPDASPERIEAFGKSLVVLVDRNNPANSLLQNKPTNRTPHAGGERIKPGSHEDAILKGWVQQLSVLRGDELAKALRYRDEEASGAGHERPAISVRRLTHSQYNNTVRDLLGDRTAPASQFPPEDFVNGFKNQYQAQSLSPMLVEAYGAAAEKLARNAFRGGNSGSLISCKPSPACRAKFVSSFGLKAFRRPLEPVEQKRYEALFIKQGNFLSGARVVVEAMLQSPNFLFRLEETSNPKWQPYARASRLSYALWDTMPPLSLLESAGRGELNTEAAVAKAARRMLDDPRAKQALDEFVSQWMRFDRVLTSTKDRRKFPQFTRETAVAMTEETRRFISDLVWGDQDFTQLFTADYGYLNADLAAVYGLRAPASEFTKVNFTPESERAGLLGQALFLALTSRPDETSPTSRGLFVREQFLCQHVADPPPGVNTNLPAISQAKPQTNRDRLAEHTMNKSCAGCHNLIDPVGFGFEKFDAIGGRREKLPLVFFGDRKSRTEKPKTVELELDTTGFVAGIKDSQFSSPKELGAVLARSPQCQECMVKQYFRYTAGRTEAPADRALIRKVTEDFRRSNFRFKELIISMVCSREFPSEGGPSRVASNH